jgi:transcriptional regulator with XRE-family HTH domain
VKTKKWQDLYGKLPQESRNRVEAQVKKALREIPLDELRSARRLTQQQLASQLDISQAVVSRVERQADMYVSTLRNFVEAMGGRLEIQAVFPDGRVIIKQFRELDRPEVSAAADCSLRSPAK